MTENNVIVGENRKLNMFLFILVFVLFILGTYISYDKYVLREDFNVVVYTDCDPELDNTCFSVEWCDDNEENCEEYFYHEVHRKVNTIPACDQYSDCEPVTCEGVEPELCQVIVNG
jgi:hypothetical protein